MSFKKGKLRNDLVIEKERKEKYFERNYERKKDETNSKEMNGLKQSITVKGKKHKIGRQNGRVGKELWKMLEINLL